MKSTVSPTLVLNTSIASCKVLTGIFTMKGDMAYSKYAETNSQLADDEENTTDHIDRKVEKSLVLRQDLLVLPALGMLRFLIYPYFTLS